MLDLNKVIKKGTIADLITDLVFEVTQKNRKNLQIEKMLKDFMIELNLFLEIELRSEISESIWEFFRMEKVGRYELWYHHYTFTGIIWTFLDWNYMRMRKCFKFCEYSSWR